MSYSITLEPPLVVIIILLIVGLTLFIYSYYYLPVVTKPQEKVRIVKVDKAFGRDQVTYEDERQVNDPLTYPYTRLPRYIIDQNKSSGFYESGAFGSASNYFDDSEKIIGNLILDPTNQTLEYPAFPIYEKPSATNRDKYFYYIIDTRLQNNYKIKVPMNNITVNGRVRYNVIENGIDQLNNDDVVIINDFNFPPNTEFIVKLYPRQSGLYYNPYLSGQPLPNVYNL